MLRVKRALISVYDKEGVVAFAKELRKHGVELISTGGTLKILREHTIKVAAVSEITDKFTAQAINYLKVSKNRLALIVNFGHIKLEYRRIVL